MWDSMASTLPILSAAGGILRGLEASSLESDVQLATKSTVITCPKDGNSGSVQICLPRFISKARAADTQEGGKHLSVCICCHIILSRK